MIYRISLPRAPDSSNVSMNVLFAVVRSIFSRTKATLSSAAATNFVNQPDRKMFVPIPSVLRVSLVAVLLASSSCSESAGPVSSSDLTTGGPVDVADNFAQPTEMMVPNPAAAVADEPLAEAIPQAEPILAGDEGSTSKVTSDVPPVAVTPDASSTSQMMLPEGAPVGEAEPTAEPSTNDEAHAGDSQPGVPEPPAETPMSEEPPPPIEPPPPQQPASEPQLPPELQSLPDGALVPTLLATRGELMFEDDCSEDRRRGLGIWSLSKEDADVCRVMHNVNRKPEHIPIASYPLPNHQNLIVQVTFRWGDPMGGKFNDQLLAIVSDMRPSSVKGHMIEAWASGTERFTESGVAITSSIGKGMVMDELAFDTFQSNTWYTAVYEVVGDEALMRVGNRVSYGKAPVIAGRKNKITLFLGTTWHELRSVRMWHATPNPEWQSIKDELLSDRGPATSGCKARHRPYPCSR